MIQLEPFVEAIVGEAIDNLGQKFALFWPSTKSTPPTEYNLVNALSEALYRNEYFTYLEVPYQGGRIDLLAIDKPTKRKMILAELKSDKRSYQEEMIKDYQRLAHFAVEKLYYPELLGNISEIFILQAIWSETSDKLVYFKSIIRIDDDIAVASSDTFPEIVRSSSIKNLRRIEINKKETLSILYFGRQLSKKDRTGQGTEYA